jgi:hypothetical protein
MRKKVFGLAFVAALVLGAILPGLAITGRASAVTLSCVAGGFSVQVDGSKVVDPGNLETGIARFNEHNAIGDSCTISP